MPKISDLVATLAQFPKEADVVLVIDEAENEAVIRLYQDTLMLDDEGITIQVNIGAITIVDTPTGITCYDFRVIDDTDQSAIKESPR